MRLFIDTRTLTFQVTRAPEPNINPATGVQGVSKRTGDPLWRTQVLVVSDEGGEIVTIKTSGPKPQVLVGQEVNPVKLTAEPWADHTSKRHGVTWFAEALLLPGEDE